MKGGGRSAQALALFEEVGDVLGAEGFEGQCVLEGAVDLLGAVDLTQGDDLLDVVGGVESLVFEPAA